jgi:hypothetical protein
VATARKNSVEEGVDMNLKQAAEMPGTFLYGTVHYKDLLESTDARVVVYLRLPMAGDERWLNGSRFAAGDILLDLQSSTHTATAGHMRGRKRQRGPFRLLREEYCGE